MVNLVIVGPLPPPRGGISVHVFRAANYLRGTDVKCVAVSPFEGRQGKVFLLWRLLRSRSVVYHFHNIGVRDRIFVGMLGALGWKVVLTVHGNSLLQQISNAGGVRRVCFRWAIRHVSHLVAVNQTIGELATALGNKHVSVLPAYLPPLPEEVQELGPDLREFCHVHRPILSANAFQIAFYQGRDLYGIDTCIELCARLREAYPRVGFLFCLPAVGDPGYLDKMYGLVASRGLQDNFLFVLERSQEFYAILQASTAFVRPTLTDGYGVSIAEALHFGVPAVASDVCQRPEGTITYRVGSMDDLYQQVVYAIEHQEELRAAIARLPEPDNFTPLLEIYRSLAAGRGGR